MEKNINFYLKWESKCLNFCEHGIAIVKRRKNKISFTYDYAELNRIVAIRLKNHTKRRNEQRIK